MGVAGETLRRDPTRAGQERPGTLRERIGRGALVVSGIVAIAYIGLALAQGGIEPQFRAGVTVFLWLVVILGVILARWPRAAIPRPALVAGLCLGGLAVFSGLSLFWADDAAAAFREMIRVLAYLGLFVAVLLASSATGARPWLVGLAAGVAGVALLAMVARTQPGLIGAAEALYERIPPTRRRLTWPGDYWNGMGVAMALGMTLLAWLGAEGRTRLARSAATALLPLMGLVLFMTSSRGGFVAAGVGMVLLLLFATSRRLVAGSLAVGGAGAALMLLAAGASAPQIVTGNFEAATAGRQGDVLLVLIVIVVGGTGIARYFLEAPLAAFRPPAWSRRAAIVGGAVAALLIIAAVNPIQALKSFAEPPDLAAPNQNATVAHLTSSTGSGRVQYWEVSLDAFATSPVGGIGAGGFGSWWGEHHSFPRNTPFAHSILIGTLAELGVVGLALVVAFLAVVAVAGVHCVRGSPRDPSAAPALAIFAAAAVVATFDWMWEYPAAFAPAIVAAALITGPALTPSLARGRSRFGFGVVTLVVGWLAIVAALLGVFGEIKTGDSEEALERGDYAEAVDAADTASTLTPWSAQPYVFKAAAREAQGDLEAAEAAVDEALERDPGDWTIWAVAARIDAQQGDVAGELAALRQANLRNPGVATLEAEGGAAQPAGG